MTILTALQNKTLNRYDRVMFLSLCAMIYFLPIAPAFIEGFFILMWLAYLIKQGTLLTYRLKADGVPSSIVQKARLLAVSFQPVATPINKALSIYIGVAVISIVLGQHHALGFKTLFFKLLQNIFTCWIFVECINTRKRFKIFCSVFLISMTLITINGLYQYVFHQGFIHGTPMTDGRVTSSFNHANNVGAYFVSILPILLSLSTIIYLNRSLKPEMPDEASRWGRLSSPWIKGAMCFLLLTMIICLGMTYSRSGWLAFYVSFTFMAIKRPKITAVIALIFTLFFVGFLPRMSTERTTNVTGDAGVLSVSSRDQYWRSALTLIKEKPILGFGLNAYTPSAKGKNLEWEGYPHNGYLHMAVELGLVGLAVFLWVMLRLLRVSLRQAASLKSLWSRNVLLGFTAGLTAFLIQSTFDPSFYSTQLSCLMWILIGAMLSLPKIEEGELYVQQKYKANV